MKNVKLLSALGMLGIGAVANADAPKLSEVLASSGITTSGYVAASYFHSSQLNSLHQFDTGHDSFHLDQAGLTLAMQPKEGFGAVVDLIAGEDARVVSFAESGGSDQFNVKQAFVQYANGGLTLIAGKYTTLIGAEVIAPTGNTNYSRGLLFYSEPLTHTGVRATYAVNDVFAFTAGVNNGWNYTATNYGSKTGELGISLTPSKAFSFTAQALFGKDPVLDAQRKIVDVVATWNATDMLSVVFSYDWGRQDSACAGDCRWSGIAGYVNLKANDQFRVSVRAEYLDDKDGLISGTAGKVKEATVTLGYAPVESFELRLEGRYDKADQAAFAMTSGTESTCAQTEFALQGVYKF